jgi:hypothetical protein
VPVEAPPRTPTKAFEADTSLEFDYFLAEQLGMTVGTMRATMSGEEWIGWQVYYGRKAQRREMENRRASHSRS